MKRPKRYFSHNFVYFEFLFAVAKSIFRIIIYFDYYFLFDYYFVHLDCVLLNNCLIWLADIGYLYSLESFFLDVTSHVLFVFYTRVILLFLL